MMRCAAEAASRNDLGTSAEDGSVPLRMISTMRGSAFDKKLHCINEGQLQQVHG
jgi:hypothetical protein